MMKEDFGKNIDIFLPCISVLKGFLALLGNLLTDTICRSIVISGEQTMTIREAIRKELRRRGWSHYRLVKNLQGTIPPTTIYEYLADKSDLGSERVSKILEVLGLTITSKSTTVKRGRRPRKEK